MLIYTIIILVCCFMYGASAVLCKYALQRESAAPVPMSRRQKIVAIVTNKIWLSGVSLSIAANIIMIQVQSVADLTIVYPILNFAYIFTLILGYFFLDELLTKAQWLGVTTTVAGAATLLFLEKTPPAPPPYDTHLAVFSSPSAPGV